jgi:hypothetical protein
MQTQNNVMTPEQIAEALAEFQRTGHITNAPAGDPSVVRAAAALRYTLNVPADGSGVDMGRHQSDQAPECVVPETPKTKPSKARTRKT